MSRYSFRAEGREIIVGWDNPLVTFFVHVWDEAESEDAPVLVVGAKPGEVQHSPSACGPTANFRMRF